jgi:hypothetical protein
LNAAAEGKMQHHALVCVRSPFHRGIDRLTSCSSLNHELGVLLRLVMLSRVSLSRPIFCCPGVDLHHISSCTLRLRCAAMAFDALEPIRGGAEANRIGCDQAAHAASAEFTITQRSSNSTHRHIAIPTTR